MKYVTRFLAAATLAIAALSTTGTALAAEPVNTLEKKGLFGYKPSGIAIRGYDTVAYFTQGAPVEGLESISTEWEGATWQFSTQEHLELFEAEPAKYAPQYGGYCAYGVAQDGLVKIEPENWTIVDDKLYLNYDDKVQKLWEKDIAGFISSADGKFENLLKSK
ncbi:MAG: YHS domain-containing (seleno)protein [Granulosicoccus sp.]